MESDIDRLGQHIGRRVSDLFVEKDQDIWGSFDEQDNRIVINEEKQPEDDCLINNAIIKTLLNGGEVHMLKTEKMPAQSPMAAFFRFPVSQTATISSTAGN